MIAQQMISLRTITLILAYIHQRSCPVLAGRHLGAAHLHQLAGWLDQPLEGMTTIRQHVALAAQLSLLKGCGLIDGRSGVWVCQPAVFEWLQKSAAEQVAWLVGVEGVVGWSAAVGEMGLEEVVGEDVRRYIEQQLRQQVAQGEPLCVPTWIKMGAEEWQVPLNSTLTPYLVFHLVQLGEWSATGPLRMTGVSVARAVGRGYARPFMQELLEMATQKRLTAAQEGQLDEWYDLWGQYRLTAGYLLQTKRPEQLKEILENRRLRKRVFAQLSPRSALVSGGLARPLGRWLEKRGAVLDGEGVNGEKGVEKRPVEAGYAWLGLKVLQGIGRLVDVPVRVSESELEPLAAQLSDHEVGELAWYAERIMADVRGLIRGRDGFFPAERPVDRSFRPLIQEAMGAGLTLEIQYQGVGDAAPRVRQVEPLRLEERGELCYLHAYCYLAEGNRVFRLDRVSAVEMVGEKGVSF